MRNHFPTCDEVLWREFDEYYFYVKCLFLFRFLWLILIRKRQKQFLFIFLFIFGHEQLMVYDRKKIDFLL